jgi:REP element-mobilizing transposase RayT
MDLHWIWGRGRKEWQVNAVSQVHRLLLTDRIPSADAQDGEQKANRFFVNVNLPPRNKRFRDRAYPLIIEVLKAWRERLKFLLCGCVWMPDPGHAQIGPAYPLLISEALHDAKKISAPRLHTVRHTRGSFGQHQFRDRFVRHAKEFKEGLDYMHMNPVGKGLVKRPEDWRWSSYNNFALEPVVGIVNLVFSAENGSSHQLFRSPRNEAYFNANGPPSLSPNESV